MEKGLGLRIQQARKTAGYTQQQLCQVSGLSYSTLAKIERGAIKAPSVFTIQAIAETLRTSIDALLGGDPPQGAQITKKRSKNGIEFVYFDINGSLVRFFHRTFSLLADRTGVPMEIIETAFWQYNDLVCRGDMSVEDFNDLLAERFSLPKVDWTEFYLLAVEPISETAGLIEWADEHYRVGLLSNSMPGLIQTMFDKGLLPDISYEVIIDSSQTGFIKPEPEIYHLAAEKTGLKPEALLLVDDSRPNLMAAARQGWHVLWFDDSEPEASTERVKQALQF
ncbi:MAG TPA: HAD-IA family hydrolase [Candidatus Saccharimonadales bacterium]|nr:HAD-IA family hydrolase [Candidatus Saccharimonadales bacterium]